jgi:hypothetical protein
MLAEEVLVIGHTGTADKPVWLGGDEVLTLLEKAQADANLGDAEKSELVSAALAGWDKLDSAVKGNITGRAEALTEAHRRTRQAVSMKVRGLTVKPQLSPDLLGLLVLQPFAGEDAERRDAETQRQKTLNAYGNHSLIQGTQGLATLDGSSCRRV